MEYFSLKKNCPPPPNKKIEPTKEIQKRDFGAKSTRAIFFKSLTELKF